MTDQNEVPNKKSRRKRPVKFPFGISTRVNRDEGIMILEFLDPDIEDKIIGSYALTKSICESIYKRTSKFLDKGVRENDD